MWRRMRMAGTAVLPAIGLLLAFFLFASAGDGVRFVDENGLPLGNTAVFLLCYSSDAPGVAVAAEMMIHTDENGRLRSPLPQSCPYLAAMHLLHQQPSGKPGHGPAYGVYATSWQPGEESPLLATGDVVMGTERPLILFHVVGSLAWQPATPDTLAQIQAGFKEASAYLYDLTEGQMAFGSLTLYTGGQGWETADFRFLPTNDYRPTAFVGGIVAAPTPYTATGGLSTVFAPGEIFLGRFWDGLNAADPVAGSWEQPAAYRTLVHEWLHYAVFLYDEYQSQPRSQTYCTCLDLPLVGSSPGACGGVLPGLAASAMAYHYTASELWHPADGQPASCQASDQWAVHGEADWETLLQWEEAQGLTADWLQMPISVTSGPALGLTEDIFGRFPGYHLFLPLLAAPGTPPAPPTDLTVQIALSTPLTNPITLRGLYPQVYVVGQNLAYHGTSNGDFVLPALLGEISFVGVHTGDRARVFVDRYTVAGEGSGGRFVYPFTSNNDPALSNSQTLTVTADSWRASLDVGYGLTGRLLTSLMVTLTTPVDMETAPTLTLCIPATGCPTAPPWHQPFVQVADNEWVVTVTAVSGTELPHYGLLSVQSAEEGVLIRPFQLAGGVGPGHIEGDAPLRDGMVMVDTETAVSGTHNRVVWMPAASYEALLAPLPAGIGGIVGLPLDIDILLPAPQPVHITLFYSQSVIDRLGISEAQLQLVHFDRLTGGWSVVPLAGNSDILNWVASQPVLQDGIYAVAWQAFQPVQANFQGMPPNGPAPLPVNFINLSTGDFDNSLWQFGDGITSTLTNPQHVYELPGFYTVTLTVSGPGGSDTLIRPNYIFVQP